MKSAFIDINDTLVYFRDNKVIHGDLKPENVMRDKNGKCKVGDFGTATIVASTTKSGELLGYSPNYSSPEML